MKKILILSLGLISMLCLVSIKAGAEDQKDWNKEHPRRAEVNKRLANQNRRINQGVKSGQLTKDGAQKLKAEDRSIRRRERRMAAKNGGHITKAQEKQLNKEENAVSRQIQREKHDGQTATPPPPATPSAVK